MIWSISCHPQTMSICLSHSQSDNSLDYFSVLKHPDHIIFIIYLTYDSIVELQITKSFYGLPYKNIRFGKLNVNQFLAETPWKNVDVQNIFGTFKDISKLIRLLLLWKYGGIYIDSKMIVKESLKNLKNFL